MLDAEGGRGEESGCRGSVEAVRGIGGCGWQSVGEGRSHAIGGTSVCGQTRLPSTCNPMLPTTPVERRSSHDNDNSDDKDETSPTTPVEDRDSSGPFAHRPEDLTKTTFLTRENVLGMSCSMSLTGLSSSEHVVVRGEVKKYGVKKIKRDKKKKALLLRLASAPALLQCSESQAKAALPS